MMKRKYNVKKIRNLCSINFLSIYINLVTLIKYCFILVYNAIKKKIKLLY